MTAAAESVTINAGAFADTFDIQATAANRTVNAGNGGDVVNLGGVAGKGMDLVRHNVAINGQQGALAVHLLDQQSSSDHTLAVQTNVLRRKIRATDVGTVTLLSTESVDQQSGTGQDTLDDAAFPMGVKVNLKTGAATGFANISGIENVIGSAFSDLLVGNDADNTLIGNGGHDILLGGFGSDTLDSGAGNDLLNASFTKYDMSATAPGALFGRWSIQDGTQEGYKRVADLRNGVTLEKYLLSPQTVYANSTKDDGRVDKLIGSAGFDWFWAMLTGPNADGMDALEGGEVRN